MSQHPCPQRAAARALTPALALALATACGASLAGPSVIDAKNDFLPTFTGAKNGDLDVVDATVIYNTATGFITLSSTQADSVGLTSSALYVWGVDRGAGVASFASNLGITGVFFDTTVQLRPNGTCTILGAVQSAADCSVTVSGNVISATLKASLLPSTGYTTNKYLWNLWPRDTTQSGIAAISDFAPDNASFTAAVVPEPASLGLMAAGLGLLAWRRRAAR